MKTTGKRFLALLLSVALVLTLMPAAVTDLRIQDL